MPQPRSPRFPALFAALSLMGSAGIADAQMPLSPTQPYQRPPVRMTTGKFTTIKADGTTASQALPLNTLDACLGAGYKTLKAAKPKFQLFQTMPRAPAIIGTQTECDDPKTGQPLIKQQCILRQAGPFQGSMPSCTPTYVSPLLQTGMGAGPGMGMARPPVPGYPGPQ